MVIRKDDFPQWEVHIKNVGESHPRVPGFVYRVDVELDGDRVTLQPPVGRGETFYVQQVEQTGSLARRNAQGSDFLQMVGKTLLLNFGESGS